MTTTVMGILGEELMKLLENEDLKASADPGVETNGQYYENLMNISMEVR